MVTIGLRELNQNPSKAVARVRSGETVVVTDRGRPVLRMVPEAGRRSALQELIESGEVTPPGELGIPDLMMELAGMPSISDILIAERDKERRR